MRYLVALVLVLFFSSTAYSQDTIPPLENSLIQGDTVLVKKPRKVYNPRIASRRSALLPGWGQIYNDSWWKVPMLYTGLGVSLYFVYFNDDRYHSFKTLLAEERALDTDDDPDTASDSNRIRVYSRNADNWRRNRDLVVITMAGIYALQIIDAAVDAHLKGFNVDENLDARVKPKFGVIRNGTPFLGLSLTIPIGQ